MHTSQYSDGENRRGSRSRRTLRGSSSSAGRPRHESSIAKNYLKSSSIEKNCLRSSSTWTSGVHRDRESLPNYKVQKPDWYTSARVHDATSEFPQILVRGLELKGECDESGSTIIWSSCTVQLRAHICELCLPTQRGNMATVRCQSGHQAHIYEMCLTGKEVLFALPLKVSKWLPLRPACPRWSSWPPQRVTSTSSLWTARRRKSTIRSLETSDILTMYVINLARLGALKDWKSTTSSLRRSFRLSRWSQCTKRFLRFSMRKWRNCTFLHSFHVDLECGTTPLVRDDSAGSHLMSAQLG